MTPRGVDYVGNRGLSRSSPAVVVTLHQEIVRVLVVEIEEGVLLSLPAGRYCELLPMASFEHKVFRAGRGTRGVVQDACILGKVERQVGRARPPRGCRGFGRGLQGRIDGVQIVAVIHGQVPRRIVIICLIQMVMVIVHSCLGIIVIIGDRAVRTNRKLDALYCVLAASGGVAAGDEGEGLTGVGISAQSNVLLKMRKIPTG
jgi:hypothetical protein